jgi:3-oxoacyl-[acyl-carrier protein] reductase
MERILREDAFRGETHIVTGAAQGIGFAVASALAVHGAQVVMVDLDPAQLAKSRDAIAAAGGVRPIAAAADVANEAQVQQTVADALAATGAIHGLVNVAGVTRDVRLVKKSLDEFKFVLGVHLHGTFLFTREVAVQHWHALFKQNGNQPLTDGVNRFIVNFSSVSARNGNVGQVDYTAAKGAIEGVTKTTAREFAGYGARVNAIAPGPVDTPMLAKIDAPGRERMMRSTILGRLAQPAEMASAVVALADPKLLGYCTGQILGINGGMYLF